MENDLDTILEIKDKAGGKSGQENNQQIGILIVFVGSWSPFIMILLFIMILPV